MKLYYISDHGESLGEKGIYLHGMPYFIAPDSQKHVASIFWADKRLKIDREKLKAKKTQALSHDNVFHTLLGLFRIKIKIYNKKLDIIDHTEKTNYSFFFATSSFWHISFSFMYNLGAIPTM